MSQTVERTPHCGLRGITLPSPSQSLPLPPRIGADTRLIASDSLQPKDQYWESIAATLYNVPQSYTLLFDAKYHRDGCVHVQLQLPTNSRFPTHAAHISVIWAHESQITYAKFHEFVLTSRPYTLLPVDITVSKYGHLKWKLNIDTQAFVLCDLIRETFCRFGTLIAMEAPQPYHITWYSIEDTLIRSTYAP